MTREIAARRYGVAVSGRAVATAAVPAAAETALDCLVAGGNAFDAAVAASLVETVHLPMKCGLAGDVVALMRGADRAVQALVAIGPGGARFSPNAVLASTGPRSVGVPGAPVGYAALARRGRRPLPELAAPAIASARAGVPWSPIAITLTREAQSLLSKYNRAIPFLPEGRLPRPGDTLRLPRLASLLAEFAERGAALFDGPAGDIVAARILSAGGLLERNDLGTASAEWAVPLEVSLGDDRVALATPLPTHGKRLLDSLAMVYETGLDPLEVFCRLTDREIPSDAGTSVVTVADEEGNAVVVVHSNSFPQYGSGVVVEELDLVLNNRPGRGFDLRPDADPDNTPVPGRRPLTTLHAWAFQDRWRLTMGATPGGQNQLPWNLQTVAALLGEERALDRLVVAPRWGLDAAGALIAEADWSGAISLPKIEPQSFRSAEQAMRLEEGRPPSAAADPRTGAVAVALV